MSFKYGMEEHLAKVAHEQQLLNQTTHAAKVKQIWHNLPIVQQVM